MTTQAIAPAVLRRHRWGWSGEVNPCPFCGKKHTHGGGALDQDPRVFLGPRVAHCADPDEGREYELAERST